MSLLDVIRFVYPEARFEGEPGGANIEIVDGEIAVWNLPDPQPTIAQLEAYAASPEYQAALAARLLKAAFNTIDAGIQKTVVDAGILSDYLFYASKVADNALLILQWYLDGRPDIDPALMDAWMAYAGGDQEALDLGDPFIAKYITAIAEAAAYRATTRPEMTPVGMIHLWEQTWIKQMRGGFALIGYQRRLQIEQAKMMPQG